MSDKKWKPSLPGNPTMEQVVLQGILNTQTEEQPDVFAIANRHLNQTSFLDNRHNIIFGAMCRLHQQGRQIEILGLMNELAAWEEVDAAGGVEYLLHLDSFHHNTSNWEVAVLKVAENAIRREMIQIGHKLSEKPFRTSIDVFDLLFEIQDDLLDIVRDHIGQDRIQKLIQKYKKLAA